MPALCQDVDAFRAGNVRLFRDKWFKYTSDKWVLDTILGADLELCDIPIQSKIPSPIVFHGKEVQALETEIQQLLKKGVIIPCSREADDFVSTIFMRLKKDGSYRMILNLRRLNDNLVYRHFKMETFQTALSLITPHCYMASIDLKDAYYSIPVNAIFQKYLKFEYDGRFYTFTCLPNGLSPAPRIFTKVLKPIYSELRKSGHVNCPYIDDSLLVGDTKSDCEDNVVNTVHAFRETGFTIHPIKSVFLPCKEIQFIGFVINSDSMKVTLPKSKADDIKNECIDLINYTQPTIRRVAEVVGKIGAALPAVQYGQLRHRLLDNEKSRALKHNKGDFEASMVLSNLAVTDLRWWSNNLGHVFKPVHLENPRVSLQSDASNQGWGGVNCDTSIVTGGQWSSCESNLHINEKEILAAFLTLRSFCSQTSSCHVRVQIDNTTAVAYVNKQGGTKEGCNNLAREMWLWAEERNIYLSATFIPGVHNCAADAQSRTLHDNMEWQLCPKTFKNLCMIWGTPCIDLFASRLNYQTPNYVSWKPDPSAVAVDSFSVSWGSGLVYVFPPFAVLGKVMQKIKRDEAEAIVVVPLWTTQPWFSALLRLLTDVIYLLPRPAVCLRSHAQHQQPPQRLRLMACRLSGNTSRTAAFLRRQKTSSTSLGGQRQRNSTKRISKSGPCLRVNGVLLPMRQL